MTGFDVADPNLDLLTDHFIEASAGTGKTYTIEKLISRLVREKGLKLEEILVVTFTRAATFELKERIRKAIDLSGEERIFTIHGFCYHTLREHAFDAKISLDQMEMSASKESLEQAVKDYLRTCKLDKKALMQLLKEHQNDVGVLVEHLVKYAAGRIPIEVAPPLALPSFAPDLLFDDLMAQAPLYGKLCDRAKCVKPEIEQGFRRFVSGDIYDSPLALMHAKNRLKSRTDCSKLHYPGLLEKLVEATYTHTNGQMLFARVAEEVRKKIEKVVEEKELLFFEDLIALMEKNVENDSFLVKVRTQYKAVFIDEFQDTDPRQWYIFKKLFLGYVPLYLVGDPKQAIYRFRGADLYTYMQAKKEVGNVHFLDQNYRSAPTLVAFFNKLFSQNCFHLPMTGQRLDYTPIKPALHEEGVVYLLTSSSEKELFEKVIEQIDLQHTTAVLIKDRYQAERFCKQCPYPTHLLRGRVLQPEAFRLLKQLLTAVQNPFDRNGVALVTRGLFSDLKAEDFMRYHMLLEEQGILCLMREIFSLAALSIVQKQGELLYQDLLQLSLLLAEKRVAKDSYVAYLQELENADEQKRLSKDLAHENSIAVMTVYASKGLEFDDVFPVGLALAKSEAGGLIYSFAKKCYTLSDPSYEAEVDAELVRQIYVAATRAKKRLYLPIIDGITSPLSEFLRNKDHGLSEAPRSSFCLPNSSLPPLLLPKEPKREFPSCPIASFSQLKVYEPIKKEGATELPKGTEVGIILHKLLEKISFKAIDRRLVETLLEGSILAEHTNAIYEMVCRVASSPLPAKSPFTLADVDPQKMGKEWEFFYKSESGYMKGFIDLFFEHGGSYYIVDYKSNVIVDSIEQEIQRHRYDLQAEIYKRAAEKFLKLFPNAHVEGVYFIFLREENGIRKY